VEEHHGTFNVAGAGVLSLSQAIRRAGRVAVPILEPGMAAFAGFVKASGIGEFTYDQLDLFVHGRVVDTGRLIEEYGFVPRTTEEAFADLVTGRGLHRPGAGAVLRPTAVTAAEALILDGIRAVRAAGRGVSRPEPVND